MRSFGMVRFSTLSSPIPSLLSVLSCVLYDTNHLFFSLSSRTFSASASTVASTSATSRCASTKRLVSAPLDRVTTTSTRTTTTPSTPISRPRPSRNEEREAAASREPSSSSTSSPSASPQGLTATRESAFSAWCVHLLRLPFPLLLLPCFCIFFCLARY
ncbi:hypothetical protein B0H11DRAFT_1975532 [Mycena galericulata]|nr:hypothetical protein B0H11DRAFT_1975532 [Mycena galericulata]